MGSDGSWELFWARYAGVLFALLMFCYVVWPYRHQRGSKKRRGGEGGRWTEDTWESALAVQARQKKVRQEARAQASSEQKRQKMLREAARADAATVSGSKRLIIGSQPSQTKMD
jgi:hypothetical protein